MTPNRKRQEALEEIDSKRAEREAQPGYSPPPYEMPPPNMGRFLRGLLNDMGLQPEEVSAAEWKGLCITLAMHIERTLEPIYDAHQRGRRLAADARRTSRKVRMKRKDLNEGAIEAAVQRMFKDPKMATWGNKQIAPYIYREIKAGRIPILGAKDKPKEYSEGTVLNIIKPIAARFRAEARS